MKKKIIISAYNVHHGGGKVLLENLLKSIPSDTFIHAFLNEKAEMDSLDNDKLSITRVHHGFFARLKAEKDINTLSSQYDHLLCFGNLPPLYKPKCKTVVFLQNKYLISKNFICWMNIVTIIRTFFEKLWFEFKKSSEYTYIVQTHSMKRTFIQNQKDLPEPFIKGFMPFINRKVNHMKSQHDFIYIASAEPHKNHDNLIEAWKILHKEGHKPKLTLVIGKSKKSNQINEIISKESLNIEIINELEREEIFQLYKSSNTLIFPSFMESFGLPLLEAKEFSLPILASEKDYVRDVINPDETFDPSSPISISRAVKRFLKIEETNLPCSAKEFLESI